MGRARRRVTRRKRPQGDLRGVGDDRNQLQRRGRAAGPARGFQFVGELAHDPGAIIGHRTFKLVRLVAQAIEILAGGRLAKTPVISETRTGVYSSRTISR